VAVTIAQIAREAGVAKATVSKVLSGKAAQERISPERARHILEVAERLNFMPNSAARAVSSGRFNAITLLLSRDRHRSNLPEMLLYGIDSGVVRAGLHLNIARVGDDQLTSGGFVPKILRESLSDGLLVNYTDHVPPVMERMMEEHHIPAVWVNSYRPGDCVHPDDHAAGRMAAERVLAEGRQRVVYADWSHHGASLAVDHYSAQHRLQGVRDGLEAGGVQPHVVLGPDPQPLDRQVELAGEVLSGPHRPDAVIAYSKDAAAGFFYHALRRGIAVPDDLLIVTFGDEPVRLAGVPVPTLLVPWETIGERAVELLARKIAAPQQPLDRVALPFTWATPSDE
jgi:LacI family transcriptional regulator